MNGPRILLVVGGGIAAYKSCELVRLIRKGGGEVTCVLTEGGSHFVTPMALAALSENPVHTTLWDLRNEVEMGHIQLSRDADLVVVCPATADLIAKMACGIADDRSSRRWSAAMPSWSRTTRRDRPFSPLQVSISENAQALPGFAACEAGAARDMSRPCRGGRLTRFGFARHVIARPGYSPDMKRSLFLAVPATLAALAASLPAFTAAEAQAGPDGATLFRQRCAACHQATAGVASPLGPNLAGVVGRKAASTTFSYSPALKASNLTWTRANLDRFITAPGKMVPGTRMVISIPDAAQRGAVLNYLATRR